MQSLIRTPPQMASAVCREAARRAASDLGRGMRQSRPVSPARTEAKVRGTGPFDTASIRNRNRLSPSGS